MNKFIPQVNLTLMCALAILGFSVAKTNVIPAFAAGFSQTRPPGWQGPSSGNPSGCSPIIDMLSTCPTGTAIIWSGSYIICASDGQGRCCDYSAWSKKCKTEHPYQEDGSGGPTYASAGYIAQYDASYFNLSCSGSAGGCS